MNPEKEEKESKEINDRGESQNNPKDISSKDRIHISFAADDRFLNPGPISSSPPPPAPMARIRPFLNARLLGARTGQSGPVLPSRGFSDRSRPMNQHAVPRWSIA